MIEIKLFFIFEIFLILNNKLNYMLKTNTTQENKEIIIEEIVRDFGKLCFKRKALESKFEDISKKSYLNDDKMEIKFRRCQKCKLFFVEEKYDSHVLNCLCGLMGRITIDSSYSFENNLK